MTTHLLPYNDGTVMVTAGSSAVTGALTAFLAAVKPGDVLHAQGHSVAVLSVTNNTSVTLVRPWPGTTATLTGSTWGYEIRRGVGWNDAADLNLKVADLIRIRPNGTSVTSLAIGAGAKTFAVQSGLPWQPGAPIRASVNGDASKWMQGVVTSYSGTSAVIDMQVTSGHTSTHAAWNLNYSGAVGATGPQGSGYGGTSSTSLTIGTGSQTVTTQAGLAYVVGSRVRIANTADPAKWMDGAVTSYSGTSLVVLVDLVAGSGTLSAWAISIAGAQGPSGSAAGAVAYNVLQTLDASEKLQARENIGAAATTAASESAAGIVELATTAEAVAGTDTSRAVTPAGLRAATRTVLSAARTYYVRKDGSDSNTGLADNAGGAFLTIQKAIDVAASLDISVFALQIVVRAGTYTENITLKRPAGAGACAINGDTVTPTNVVINPASGSGFTAAADVLWAVSGFTLDTPNGSAVLVTNGGRINLGAGIRFVRSTWGHMYATRQGAINITSPYTVAGSANMHAYAEFQGQIIGGGYVVTITGTPAFAYAWAYASHLGLVLWYGGSFSGGATGPKYRADLNAVVDSFANGVNFFPGDVAGSVANGGQYR